MARPSKQAMSAISAFGNDFYSLRRGYEYKEGVSEGGIALYGKNNDYPEKLLRLLGDSPWHYKGVKGSVKFIVANGLGLTTDGGNNITDLTGFANIIGEDWQDIDEKVSEDLKVYDGFALQVIWSNDGTTIADVYHQPFAQVRAGEKDEFGRITDYYIGKWKRGRYNAKPENADRITAFNPSMSIDEPRQLLYCKFNNILSEYYPEPGYRGIIDNILIDKLLNKHKVAFLRNAINVSSVMQMVTDKSDKEFQKFINNFDRNLSGATNSGRTAYLKVAPGTQFHQITNPNSKVAAEAFNSYYEQNRDIILAGHDIIYRDMFGIESTQSSLAADRVIEKSVLYNNTVAGRYHNKKLQAYNKLAPFIFGDQRFAVKPLRLFDGLADELRELGLMDPQSTIQEGNG